MIRPGLVFMLWLAIALFVVLNNAVGDTWIAPTLPVRAVCGQGRATYPYRDGGRQLGPNATTSTTPPFTRRSMRGRG